ncbi:hypothetical protein SAMN05428975_2738 [Mucilaginibacter sp. OK268]|nr:hypothetical protein SAMN05428975_2738 [Mucilaginibacter sp. OK268]
MVSSSNHGGRPLRPSLRQAQTDRPFFYMVSELIEYVIASDSVDNRPEGAH